MGRTRKQVVIDALTQAIETGDVGPGGKLRAERALSDKHGVSREVVRGALHSLAEQGLIEARQGSGWFIRKRERLPFPLHTIDLGRAGAVADVWDTWLTRLGKTAGNELSVDPAAIPPMEVAAKLELEPGTPTVRRHRVRLVDREPWMLSTGWWPRWLAAGTEIEGPRQHSPLQVALRLGHGQERSENEIGARMPTHEEATELGIPRGVPVITMLTTGWNAQGRPMRCTSDVFPADRFLLVNEIRDLR